jgi:hypothetical protein
MLRAPRSESAVSQAEPVGTMRSTEAQIGRAERRWHGQLSTGRSQTRRKLERTRRAWRLGRPKVRPQAASSASKYVLRQRRQSLQKCEQFAIHFF